MKKEMQQMYQKRNWQVLFSLLIIILLAACRANDCGCP